MSFLASLFCCSEGQTDTHEATISPKLTQTQSNIQKALSNRQNKSEASLSSKSHNQQQKIKVVTKSPSSKSIKTIGSNNNNNTGSIANTSTDNSNKLKKKKSSNNTTNIESQTKSSNHKRNMTDSTVTSLPTSENLPISDTDYKSQNVREITDSKDTTDSSRDDETINHNQNSSKNTDNSTTDQKLHDNEKDVDMNDVDDMDEDIEEDVSYEDDDEDEDMSYNDEELDLTKIQTDQAVSSESGWLLDTIQPTFKNKKCLVLDLDETLVHSSFKYVRHSDFIIPVDIDNQIHNVYVIKRPGVDEFLKKCGELFEVVVFTASVSRYGDPLLDILDVNKSIHHRLFRESCYNYQGNYVKNLSQMGRPLEDLIIIDNSPASYIFHPQHSVPISSWFSDTHDCELTDLLPFLEDLANEKVDDVSLVLDVNL